MTARKKATKQEMPKPLASAAGLRRRAEALLREGRGKPSSAATGPRSEVDTQRLLHELQVHQVELEMQNAELQEARDRMEVLLEKYTNLYDFAPVGYFSLDEDGVILEVNLTGASLLGVERSRLISQYLPRFVTSASRPVVLALLESVFAGVGSQINQICEASLFGKSGAFWADLQASSAISLQGKRRLCRVAVSDITALKRADEAQLRAEALVVTNRELEKEIVQRQAVEKSLQESEWRQGQLLEQSRRMQVHLRHLSHQILQAQEEERKRISRELHDEIAQTLVGINVHLENLAREATVNPKSLKRQIKRTQKLVERSVDTVHQFARELRPTLLDDLGLIASLHSFTTEFAKRTRIRVHFTTFASGRIEELGNDERTALYRVAQEALTNVAKHAQASRVEVHLQKLPGILRMIIKDNGKSFQVERLGHAAKNEGLGLLGMRERMEMIGGSFSLESAPGQGTTVRVEIPFGTGPAGKGLLTKPAGKKVISSRRRSGGSGLQKPAHREPAPGGTSVILDKTKL